MSGTRSFLERFRDADPRFGPVPAWWWSGEPLEWSRMQWQMDQLRAMGLRHVVVINLAPSGTLFGSDADDPAFLSEPWWAFFERTCDHARKIGMSVWFYDQIGFSGANFQADLVAADPTRMGQRLHVVSVEGDGRLRVVAPRHSRPIGAYRTPLGAPGDVRSVALDGSAAEIETGTAERLALVYAVRQGYDLFSPVACQALLDTVHRQFQKRLPQHFGTTIVGSFQDELPELPTWGATFADSFFEVYGYRLEPRVHHLFEPGGDLEARRTRLHYHAHRAALAERAFFRPLFEWHEQNGLLCGCDQQSPAREARAVGCVSKYADYLQTHRWYAAPGSDVHGNSRLHGSIAFLNARPRVWLEGFHSTGWGGTLADTVDWMLPHFQSGANLYNPHAVYYGTRKGWWEWAPPSTCWRQPYARHYPPFADMIARLCKFLSTGVQQASVGVLFPTSTVQAGMGAVRAFDDAVAADQALHETIGSMRWHQSQPGPLDSAGIDFHILDEHAIHTADCADGRITIRGVALRALILPGVTVLRDATAERLFEFAAGGGRLVAFPVDRWTTESGRTIDVRSIPNAVVVAGAGDLPGALRDLERPVEADGPFLHRRDGATHLLFVPAVTGMATVVRWPGWFDPVEHASIVPERYRQRATLRLPASAGDVMRFDPLDGSATPLPLERRDDDGRPHVTVDFNGAPFAVLAWTDSPPADAAGAPIASDAPAPSRSIDLADPWRCQLVPTLPDTFVDTHDPTQPDRRWPHTAEFRWRDDDRDWSIRPLPDDPGTQWVRAGFGVRAWIDDPAQPAAPRKPVVYSPHYGIATDPVHIHTLGPKGRVPEEFIDLGRQRAGAPVRVCTGVVSDARRMARVAVGANAGKSVRVGEARFIQDDNAYFWVTPPISLSPGENRLELTFTPDRDEAVRAFWCLIAPQTDDAALLRPERITAPDAPSPGSLLRYATRLRLRAPLRDGRVKISVAAAVAVSLNGTILGRQGGFDPYRPGLRGCVYTLPPLPAGEHELAIELTDPGGRAPLVVDVLGTLIDGATVAVRSGADGWTVSRDGGKPTPVQLHRKPDAAGSAWHLWRRPHPLPRAGWAESSPVAAAGASPVLDLPLVPPLDAPRVQWLEWVVPPGAVKMRLPLASDAQARLWVDGAELPLANPSAVDLPADTTGARPARRAALRVLSRQAGGGVLNEAVTYAFDEGLIRAGAWLQQGLRSYSGAVRLWQRVDLPDDLRDRPLTLDLGRVRGTVEASANGCALGVRFMPPYTFDLTKSAGVARAGALEIELLVTNTLANHLSTWSPTRWWSPDQLEFGLLGPPRLIAR